MQLIRREGGKRDAHCDEQAEQNVDWEECIVWLPEAARLKAERRRDEQMAR